jgi:thymidylate synthase
MTSYVGEEGYLTLLREILDHGIASTDRTGVGTIRLFCRSLRFDLQKGFPLFTSKAVPFKSVLSELLWFIEGSFSERRLAEILHDKDAAFLEDVDTIWTANANAERWIMSGKPQFEGDLGRVYGAQWRTWRAPRQLTDGRWTVDIVDQLGNVIEGIKKDPDGRRHIVEAWNPGEIDNMALPPCHMSYQFVVHGNLLHCRVTLRSWDMFLGAPFNVASYALLAHMVAQVCGLKVGELVLEGTDVHIYQNHLGQVKELLTRKPTWMPTLRINPSIDDIDDFKMTDFEISGYKPNKAIKAPMAV